MRQRIEEKLAAGEARLSAGDATEKLGLSPRVLRALLQAGLVTVQDVVNRLEEGREATLAIPGLGVKSLEEIETRLRARGLLK